LRRNFGHEVPSLLWDGHGSHPVFLGFVCQQPVSQAILRRASSPLGIGFISRDWLLCPVLFAASLSQVDTAAAIQTLAEYIGAQDNANVAWLKHTIQTNPKANTLLKAVIVNEFLEYPRDIVAIAATPSIARAIGRAPPKVKS